MLVEGGDDHDHRQAAAPPRLRTTSKPLITGICRSRKTRSGLSFCDLLQGFLPLPASPTIAISGNQLQFLAQDAARDGLIVHDQRRMAAVPFGSVSQACLPVQDSPANPGTAQYQAMTDDCVAQTSAAQCLK